jgi:tRNA (adenine57-N1/adenine58-N1)-methyltransferase
VLKTKGALCNFSPCIEQVQKASQEMAREGFYDIRTYECLNRELTAKQQSFKTIPDYDLLKS